MEQHGPLSAIREKCRDCVCGSYKEQALCTCKDCPLYVFRFGVRPGGQAYRRKVTLAKRKWPKDSREVGLK